MTTTGATIESLASLTDDQVIVPKLFRRVADCIRLFGPSLACLPAYLAGGADEYFVPDQDKSIVGLQHVVEVTNGTFRMTRPIEDLVFVEKQTGTGKNPPPGGHPEHRDPCGHRTALTQPDERAGRVAPGRGVAFCAGRSE